MLNPGERAEWVGIISLEARLWIAEYISLMMYVCLLFTYVKENFYNLNNCRLVSIISQSKSSPVASVYQCNIIIIVVICYSNIGFTFHCQRLNWLNQCLNSLYKYLQSYIVFIHFSGIYIFLHNTWIIAYFLPKEWYWNLCIIQRHSDLHLFERKKS